MGKPASYKKLAVEEANLNDACTRKLDEQVSAKKWRSTRTPSAFWKVMGVLDSFNGGNPMM